MKEVMDEAELQEMVPYVYRQQNTVTQLITTRPIMELCLAEESRPESQVDNKWWDQEDLDVEGTQMADQEKKREEGEEDT